MRTSGPFGPKPSPLGQRFQLAAKRNKARGRFLSPHQRPKADKRYEILRAAYQELWDLWNTAPSGYHTLDSKMIITAVNQTEADMLGYSVSEMIGKSILEFIHSKERAIAGRRGKQKLAGQKVPVKERTYIRKDTTPITMSAEDSVIYDAKGNVIGMKTVLVDISKLIELERHVLRLLQQDELGKLAGGFAHELGNLICPILVAAQDAKTHLGDEANPHAIAQL
ncbi:MAG: PAS domain-containing protein, partial [Candidatus Margulisiibacteriota bacterium]